jgi:dihydroxyacetone kinase-like predicted kinase
MFKNDFDDLELTKPGIIVSSTHLAPKAAHRTVTDEVPYGYCTEFIIKGEGLDPDKFHARIKRRGESIIVVGDQSAVKVHIHTLDPGSIVRLATALGTIHQVSIRNMDEQHQDFLLLSKYFLIFYH